MSQLLDRVVVDKLANSKTFQRAALKTAEHVEKARHKGVSAMAEAKDAARVARDEVQSSAPSPVGFMKELKKAVEKDLESISGGGKKG